MPDQQTAEVVREFIEEVWNKHNPEAVDRYLDENYVDHDNRTGLEDFAGLKQWVRNISAAFDHQTIIEDQVTEGDRTALRVTFRVVHIGKFGALEATGKQAETTGYRFFRVANGKIVEHWAHLDREMLLKQLTGQAA